MWKQVQFLFNLFLAYFLVFQEIEFSMKKYLAGFFLVSLVFIASCSKDNLTPITTLNVRLTNHLDSTKDVSLDIRDIKVSIDDDTAWLSLKPNAGVYNLTDYKNGIDTSIASGKVQATHIVNQLRLAFGSNNTIKVNKQVLPLIINTNSINEQMLIEVGAKMNREEETVTLDVSSASTIKETVDGNFVLTPVITIKKNQ